MTIKEIKQRIALEINLTKRIKVINKKSVAHKAGCWTAEYCEGYIDGLLRAIELLNPNN